MCKGISSLSEVLGKPQVFLALNLIHVCPAPCGSKRAIQHDPGGQVHPGDGPVQVNLAVGQVRCFFNNRVANFIYNALLSRISG